MRLRLDFSCLTSLLEIAFDRGSGHPKYFDDVLALISLIDGTKDAFSQIGRIRFHRLPPFDACLLLLALLSFYHWLRNSAKCCREPVEKESWQFPDRKVSSDLVGVGGDGAHRGHLPLPLAPQKKGKT